MCPATSSLRNLVLLVALALLTSCGASAQRQATINTGFTALNALRDGFAEWDKQHQEQIVDKATSLEDGKAQLATYRAARLKIEAAFVAAYNAFVLAALDVNDDTTYKDALKSARDLVAALSVLRGGGK